MRSHTGVCVCVRACVCVVCACVCVCMCCVCACVVCSGISEERIDKKIEEMVEEGKRRRKSNPRKESATALTGTSVSESRYPTCYGGE